MNDMVVIESLRKSYGDTEILSGINLTVRRGEATVIVGASGSGKSTCLRCINRLEEPSGGRILVDGINVRSAGGDLNKVRQKIGMVFQGIFL